jgi:hypothetical protein
MIKEYIQCILGLACIAAIIYLLYAIDYILH